jgi:hypothetical protein
MTHARQLGVEVRSVAGYSEWCTAAREVLRSRPDGAERIDRLRPPPDTQDMGYFVAVDDTGRPVAVSVVALFTGCAVLVWSVSAPHHPAASSSRYLLHTFMRSDLRRRGVRHLIAGSGMRDSPGLHYFQHLLGYEVRNLRIRVGESSQAVSTFVSDACRDEEASRPCAPVDVDATPVWEGSKSAVAVGVLGGSRNPVSSGARVSR